VAFIEFNLTYELGRGLNVRAYKSKIDNNDAMDIRNLANAKLWHSGFKELTQDELEKLKIQLDPIILDQFGYIGYDLVYFTPTYSLGITSLDRPSNDPGHMVNSEPGQTWRDWYTPNWHSTT
jgi:hypothetical protein